MKRVLGFIIYLAVVIAAMLGLLVLAGGIFLPESKIIEQVKTKEPLSIGYPVAEIVNQVSADQMEADVRALSLFPTRMVGTPGDQAAGDYIIDRLKSLGYDNPRIEPFRTVAPVDKGTSITILPDGARRPLYPLWPNHLRTTTLPKDGLEADLVYVGDGSLVDCQGKNIKDSIILIDFNVGIEWLNAVKLGARAVIFIEPESTNRIEAESKFLTAPVDMPRFWLDRAAAGEVLSRLRSGEQVRARIESRVDWEQVTSRNIFVTAPGADEKMAGDKIVFEAYYDSMSVVLGKAPGAEMSVNAAMLLQVAELLKKFPPKRTVELMFTSGHFIQMSGMRAFMSRHMDAMVAKRKEYVSAALGSAAAADLASNPKLEYDPRMKAFISLDFSSHNDSFGVFYRGVYYEQEERFRTRFSATGTFFQELTDALPPVFRPVRHSPVFDDVFQLIGRAMAPLKDRLPVFVDGINPFSGRAWRSYIIGGYAFDFEAVSVAGGPGLGFVTTYDSRVWLDTPFDVPGNVDFGNLWRQGRLLAYLVTGYANSGKSEFPGDHSFSRQTLGAGYARLTGKVVTFAVKKAGSFIPNDPMPGSVVIVKHKNKSLMGVRPNWITIVNNSGEFEIDGLPPLTATADKGMLFTVESFKFFDPDDRAVIEITDPVEREKAVEEANIHRGEIQYAPDQGNMQFPNKLFITTSDKHIRLVMFRCHPISLFGMANPLTFTELGGVSILDAVSDSTPQAFGISLPFFRDPDKAGSGSEDAMVVFVERGAHIKPEEQRVKILMSGGLSGLSLALLNSSASNPTGVGYQVIQRSIDDIPYKTAKDIWFLDDDRIKRLESHKILSDCLAEGNGLDEAKRPLVCKLHRLAAGVLEQIGTANLKEKQDYREFYAQSRKAWQYELMAYPQVRKIENDAVKGVLFYLALLLPFSFFLERLLFAQRNLQKQLLTMAVIFLGVFFAFRYVHPAFKLAINPMFILLTFVILALSILVTFLVVGKFEEQIRKAQRTVESAHEADVGRLSVMAVAFSLGISNMRRRKGRTILTCITLILLTFTVLSFTSVVQDIRINKIRGPEGKAPYNGILIRDGSWVNIKMFALRYMSDEFGQDNLVVPRSWAYSSEKGEENKRISYKLTSTNTVRSAEAHAALGLSSTENSLTHPETHIKSGGWFLGQDRYTCLLSREMADNLGITDMDVIGPETPETSYDPKSPDAPRRVVFLGVQFWVRGIYDSPGFDTVKDLDGEQITPVDYVYMETRAMSRTGAVFESYDHISSKNIFVIPYDTLMSLNGGLRSVAVGFGPGAAGAKRTEAVLDDMMRRVTLNIYAGIGDKLWRFSALASTSISGMGDLFIPIVIAALIVLNTMLGSVFEREKEIEIFSSLGLAPAHVSALFFAESMVYAVLGAVSGYLIGQGVAKLITDFNLLPGLSLNFSSLSAVFSTGVVIAVVLLSTIYPARKASQAATPSIDRTWHLPEPDGDKWGIDLPFSVTAGQVLGLRNFLYEWLYAYNEYSVGDIITQQVEAGVITTPQGEGQEVRFMAWLAPFDLGVSQTNRLQFSPTSIRDIYEVHLEIRRESGGVSDWKRTNHRFLYLVRKQFLIWRTIRQEEKDVYGAMASTPGGEAQAAAADGKSITTGSIK